MVAEDSSGDGVQLNVHVQRAVNARTSSNTGVFTGLRIGSDDEMCTSAAKGSIPNQNTD